MKIKVFVTEKGYFPQEFTKGDWIDLVTAESITLKVPHAKMLHKQKTTDDTERFRDVVFNSGVISLGIAMELPKGYEAIIAPRSSAFKTWGVLVPNSIGIIDNSYSGMDDIWKLPVLATENVTIPRGTRIAQFRIQLSQKASFWQKFKWLFSNKIKLVRVSTLNNGNRGGFGSTGINIK